jgi:hypothetical protein
MMGAGNVKLAYGHYAGKVPAGSLLALAFMALVAKDADDPPLFWGGHESLALSVLGRKGAYTATDARAVGRLITPLLKAGAIEVDKRSAPIVRSGTGSTSTPTPDGNHPTNTGRKTVVT